MRLSHRAIAGGARARPRADLSGVGRRAAAGRRSGRCHPRARRAAGLRRAHGVLHRPMRSTGTSCGSRPVAVAVRRAPAVRAADAERQAGQGRGAARRSRGAASARRGVPDQSRTSSTARRARRPGCAPSNSTGCGSRYGRWTRRRCRRGCARAPAASASRWTPRRRSSSSLRVEGNLLAAKQELDKLALLAEGAPHRRRPGAARRSATARATTCFSSAQAAAAGDAARALRVLLGLKSEGVEPTLILWALVRELRGLWQARERDRLRSARRRQPAGTLRPRPSPRRSRASGRCRWRALLRQAQPYGSHHQGGGARAMRGPP